MLAENRAVLSTEIDVEYRGGDWQTINRCDGIRDLAGGHDMCARRFQDTDDFETYKGFILDHEDDAFRQ